MHADTCTRTGTHSTPLHMTHRDKCIVPVMNTDARTQTQMHTAVCRRTVMRAHTRTQTYTHTLRFSHTCKYTEMHTYARTRTPSHIPSTPSHLQLHLTHHCPCYTDQQGVVATLCPCGPAWGQAGSGWERHTTPLLWVAVLGGPATGGNLDFGGICPTLAPLPALLHSTAWHSWPAPLPAWYSATLHCTPGWPASARPQHAHPTALLWPPPTCFPAPLFPSLPAGCSWGCQGQAAGGTSTMVLPFPLRQGGDGETLLLGWLGYVPHCETSPAVAQA